MNQSKTQDLEEKLVEEVGSRLLEENKHNHNYSLFLKGNFGLPSSDVSKIKDIILANFGNSRRGRIKRKVYDALLRLGIDLYSKDVRKQIEQAEKALSERRKNFDVLLEDFVRLNNEGYLYDPLPDVSKLPDVNPAAKQLYEFSQRFGFSAKDIRERLTDLVRSSTNQESEIYALRFYDNELAQEFKDIVELQKQYEAEKEKEVKGVKKRVYGFFSKIGLNLYGYEARKRARRIEKYKRAIKNKLAKLKEKLGKESEDYIERLAIIKENPEAFEHYKNSMGIKEKVHLATELCKLYARRYEESKRKLEEHNANIEQESRWIDELKEKAPYYRFVEQAEEKARFYDRMAFVTKAKIESKTKQLHANKENKEFLSEMIELGQELNEYEQEKEKWSRTHDYMKETLQRKKAEDQDRLYKEIGDMEAAKKRLEQESFNLAVETAKAGSELSKYQRLKEIYSTMHNQVGILHSQYSKLLRNIKIDSVMENNNLGEKEKALEIKACLGLNPS